MNSRAPIFYLILGIAFSILVSFSVAHLVIGQSENATLADENNTRRIINLINNTVTVVDKTTNETISVMPYEGGSTSSNNITTAGSFPTITENSTMNANITEK